MGIEVVPVYSKNTSYDKIMQVSIAKEACLGKQTTFSDILSPQNAEADRNRPVIESIAGGINGQIPYLDATDRG